MNDNDAVTLEFVRLRPTDADLPAPAYATEGSSGMDVAAAVPDEVSVPPHGRVLVPTGLAVSVPPGHELQVRPRSGLALKHGVTVLNSPGTIDSDYRGEIKVILVNLGEEPVSIKRGDRIAQLVLSRVCKAELVQVETLDETSRGSGGFGHSGGN